MILQIDKLTVTEDASPNTIVELVPVTAGPDGAAVFGVSNEHNTDFKIGAGQTYIDRANPSFNIAVLRPDNSDVTQLETWASNQTEVYISALTLDGGFFFGDVETLTGAIKIRTNQTLSDNDVYVFEVTRETTPGFDPATGLHQSGFWAGGNLIGGYEWGDADGDNFADGWREDSGTFNNTTFSSGQQTLEVNGDSARFERRIFFPFESEQITFSFTVDTYNAIDAFEIQIVEFDVNDSVISSTDTLINSTGRKSVTVTTSSGSNLSFLKMQAVLNNSTTGTTVSEVISDPALKLGTDSTYSKF